MFSDKDSFKQAFIERLETMHGKCLDETSAIDRYKTLGQMVREYSSKNWIATNAQYREKGAKRVFYFSMEFLLGRLMGNSLLNLGLRDMCQEGLRELGIDLAEIEDQESDAALGNGGLGRLAACFLDSLASLHFPADGYGIRYKYGLFEQKIVDGYQRELPEQWLNEGNVWEVRKSDSALEVRFGGEVRVSEVNNKLNFEHLNYESVLAVPYDIPVVGYQNKTVNNLRLWSAESTARDARLLNNLNSYARIVDYKNSVESISEYLYPDDTYNEGKRLRLKQQYFLVSAGVQSIVRYYKKWKLGPLADFPKKIAIHINDTHPVLAIPELMRILMDEEGLNWDEAWEITTKTMSYTNHTTLTEALEKWPVEIMKPLLPRIYMIIEEINERFCKGLWNRYPGEWDRIKDMAIIADNQVKMAHLAIVAAHSVNGVARLHTQILRKREMKNFADIFPQKFNNKTNGITHRRWLLWANPELARLVTETLGDSWIKHPTDLIGLMKFTRDRAFQEEVARVKLENKTRLAGLIKDKYGIVVDPASVFDVQIKRLHAYKRQLLNILHVMDLYNKLRENPNLDMVPRTVFFGAKAAPGYHLSKNIIKLINTVAARVNNDPKTADKLKIVFLENYRVTLAEQVIPAADVSEQISTASKEASGTGNMKFMMNGALTLGTLDGANVEIRDAVGNDNIFIFGLTAAEVTDFYERGGYNAWEMYLGDDRIRTVVDQLVNGFLPTGENEFSQIYHFLLSNNDEYFVLKDFAAYADAQLKIDHTYRNRQKWLEMCIVNIAHAGKFSSDRTIKDYASGIWDLYPVLIT